MARRRVVGPPLSRTLLSHDPAMVSHGGNGPEGRRQRRRTARVTCVALTRAAGCQEPVPEKAIGVVRRAARKAAPGALCHPVHARRGGAAGGLASAPGGRQAGHAYSLASKGLPSVLAPEIEGSRAATCTRRAATTDRGDGSREPHVGRGTDCRRAPPEAGDSGLATDG